MTTLAFDKLELPYRQAKPRTYGITMVLDKGVGLSQTENFLDVSAEYCDVVKFGWATSRLISKKIIIEKVRLLRKNNIKVCLGGSFGELAYAKGMSEYLMDEAIDIGFDSFEVSDGIVDIAQSEKLKLIEMAVNKGFTVFSEQGKKDELEDRHISVEQRIKASLDELNAGASKIIMEARESGTFGIFDNKGEVIPNIIEDLCKDIELNDIMFEAPLVKQQEWLVSNFGPNINLGNVSLDDCMTLESVRRGLRAATMIEFHLSKREISLRLGPAGALEAANEGDTIIIVDALRASSTIVTALGEKIRSVKPVLLINDCHGELTAGERGGKKSPNLMYDNSPNEFLNEKFKDKELVLTTTNGTECIHAAASGKGKVLIGSMLNLKAIASYAEKHLDSGDKNISIIIAGRNNAIADEDLHVASEIAFSIKNSVIKGYIKPVYYEDSLKCFINSDSGVNLISQGKIRDVEFCAQRNLYDVVPYYNNETKKITLL